ncbi:hypothetical protein Mal64_24800 [Pseudobythopirellula maris]|uniref:Uncharacterized protein n=1 Tax=Pseudobythopirellula maris TaxID=2527991 RepID=A0A5C5ZNG4_9BACT|nr:hypothetical protein [Pseudobythopirellula maris]TWT88989.1 hypothetical protein Mal64_24800 [Pseudobythopirellula maris]
MAVAVLRSVAALCFLPIVPASVASAQDETPPTEQEIGQLQNTITDMRNRLVEGGRSALQASSDEFRDALRRHAEDRAALNGQPHWGNAQHVPTMQQPMAQPPGAGRHSGWPQWPTAASHSQAYPNAAQQDYPAQQPGYEASQNPVQLVQQTAFELDRLAHTLERRQLYEQADRLRETARGLRESVRQTGHRPVDNHSPSERQYQPQESEASQPAQSAP